MPNESKEKKFNSVVDKTLKEIREWRKRSIGPIITIHTNPGRHVGLNIPEEISTEEFVRLRRVRRKKKPGMIRAIHNR